MIVQRGARRLPDHFRLAVFFGSFFERKSKKNLQGERWLRNELPCPCAACGLRHFFLRTFGLPQKYQKVKHGEKLRVSSPSLAERAQKTSLFCTPAPGARAVAATSSALFAVRSCRPPACERHGFRCEARINLFAGLRDLVFLYFSAGRRPA